MDGKYRNPGKHTKPGIEDNTSPEISFPKPIRTETTAFSPSVPGSKVTNKYGKAFNRKTTSHGFRQRKNKKAYKLVKHKQFKQHSD